MNLTQTQIDKVQIDEGLIYLNFDEVGETFLAPCKGGGEFSSKTTIRDIEYDRKKGKTKGLQVVDDQSATLKVTTLGVSQANIANAIAGCKMNSNIITNSEGGLIPATKYLKNITMFARTIDGKFKKIMLFNALNEGDFTLSAKPKSEGEITFEFVAHFDPLDDTKVIYQIEDVDTIDTSVSVS